MEGESVPAGRTRYLNLTEPLAPGDRYGGTNATMMIVAARLVIPIRLTYAPDASCPGPVGPGLDRNACYPRRLQ